MAPLYAIEALAVVNMTAAAFSPYLYYRGKGEALSLSRRRSIWISGPASGFRYIKRPMSEAHRSFYVSLLENYSSGTMAPLGQVSLQEPQSRQAAASMT